MTAQTSITAQDLVSFTEQLFTNARIQRLGAYVGITLDGSLASSTMPLESVRRQVQLTAPMDLATATTFVQEASIYVISYFTPEMENEHYSKMVNSGLSSDDVYTHGVICESDLSVEEASETGLFLTMRQTAQAHGLVSSTYDVLEITAKDGSRVYAILDCWKPL